MWAASASASLSAPLPEPLPGPLLNEPQTLHREEQLVGWNYRIAALHTLVALVQGSPACDMLHGLFKVGLAGDNVSDLFSNLLLLVTSGDVHTRSEFPGLRARFSADANALKAADQFALLLEDAIKMH